MRFMMLYKPVPSRMAPLLLERWRRWEGSSKK